MPRRIRFPEGIVRRFLLAGGMVLPLFFYSTLRFLPLTRSFVLGYEARVARVFTRMQYALHYVFRNDSLEEDALVQCESARKSLAEEFSSLRYATSGPLRTLPVQVIARSYGGDPDQVLVWKQEGDPFVVGEAVGVGNVLLGILVEAKDDLGVVRLVTHKESTLPVMVLGKESTGGNIRGTGGAWLSLEYVPKGSALAVGDVLVTSGLGSSVPRGLVLGTVREVIDADPSPFYRISVEPLLSSDHWWEADVFHLPHL